VVGKKRFAIPTFAICAMLVLFEPVGRPQVDTATITGRVLDPLNAVIPNAAITALNVDTQITRKTVTNSDGLFTLSGLLPGNYRIEAAKAGFKTVIKPDVTLHVQDVIAINFDMILGSITESVTVGAGAPLVNTESGAVSTVIDRQFVENLPMNGRSFNTLLQLTPGAVTVGTVASGGDMGQFTINGQRADANYFTVDGVGVNFGANGQGGAQGVGGGVVPAFNAIGGTSSLVSVDAMQEFRIQTSSFAPEYGHQPGGEVAIETRSGTDAFHGGASDYFRNTVLDANNWFSDAHNPPLPRAAEHQNDFGGFLGGPIVLPGFYDRKNKTFFFFSYEGLRLRQPQSAVTLVPDLAVRNSAIPAAAPYLKALPLPNGPEIFAVCNPATDPTCPPSGRKPTGVAQFTGNWSNPATVDATSVRVDQSLNDRWSLFGRFNESPSASASRGSIGALSEIDTTEKDTRTLTVGLNGMVTPNLTNSLRVNYSRQIGSLISTQDSLGGAVPIDAGLLLAPPLNASVGFGILIFQDSNGAGIGNQGQTKSTQFSIVDSIATSKGTHQLKFGVDYRGLWTSRTGEDAAEFFASSGEAFASSATVNVAHIVQLFSSPAPRTLLHSLSLYGQDTWKIARRLTITYGLRWELDPPPSALGVTSLASWTNVNNPSTTMLAPAGTPSYKTTYTNFAPRLGIAYRLTSSGDFVVRGAVGIFYDTGTGTVGNLLQFFPNTSTAFGLNPLVLPLTTSSGLAPLPSAQPPYSGQIEGIAPDLHLPRSYQWNVAVEKSLGAEQAVSLTYVGQVGRGLLRFQHYSIPSSNPNFAPGSSFYLSGNGDTSDYEALQVQWRKHFSKGLQGLANYTWGHSIDSNSSDAFFNGSDQVVSAQGTRGSSSFDVRQNFTAALTYNIPNPARPSFVKVLMQAWSLSLIADVRTGFPIDVHLSRSLIPGFLGTSRPDLVPGQPIWIDDSTKPGGKYLNPAAFVVPATPRQGDLGRNAITGYGLTQFDTSIARQFSLTERWKLQVRGDLFNLFNHPNFANPDSNLADRGSFGIASRTLNVGLGGLSALYQVGGPRSAQLSLKLMF
jgi:hypothetical protein